MQKNKKRKINLYLDIIAKLLNIKNKEKVQREKNILYLKCIWRSKRPRIDNTVLGEK